MTTIIVANGGDPPHPALAARLPRPDAVIAADSGYDHARALGLRVDVLVGDLDSISASGLRHAEGHGVVIDRHPADKDATDLELAIDRAVRAGAVEIVVAGGGGGRLDHALAELALLASPRYAAVTLSAWSGRAAVEVLHGGGTRHVRGTPGELVTLLAAGGPAVGIRTDGLRFPLDGDTLRPGETRGVSNELLATDASVHLGAGTLLIIRPHALNGEPR